MTRRVPLLLLAFGLALGGFLFWTLRPAGGGRGIASPDGVLEAEADFRGGELAEVEPVPAGSANLEPAADPVRRASPGTRNHATLEPRFSLPFRLVDERGQPVAQAKVMLHRKGAPEPEERELETQAGDLDLAVSGPGTWSVMFQAPRYTREGGGRFAVFEVPFEGERTLVRFTRNGAVAGRVVDELGVAVAAIEVHVRASEGGSGHSLKSEADGSFHVPDMPAGLTTATATTRFMEETVEFVLPPGGIRKVEIRIPVCGYIQGHVLDAEGVAIKEAAVVLASDVEIAGVETDEAGFFRLGPLPPDEYKVFAVRETGSNPEFFPSVDVRVLAGETVEVTLRPPQEEPHVLRGRVYLRDEALAECEIMAFDEQEGLLDGLRAATTDKEGNYELPLLRAGAHLFYFEPDKDPRGDPSAPQRVLIGEDQHQQDFHLPRGEIRGRTLAPEGEGAVGIRVVALREDGYLDQLLPFDDGSVRSGKDGRYTLTLLEDGLYTVLAYGKSAYHHRTGIRVSGDILTGIDLEPRPSGRVQGVVLDQDVRAVEKASVFARDEAGRLLFGHRDGTDALGRFEFDVPAGEVTLFARMWGAASPDTASLVVHPEQTTGGIELRMAPAARLIIRTRRDGEPAPATIRVFDADGREVSRAQVDLEGMPGALKDPLSATERSVGPLLPGTYRVTATSSAGRTATRSASLGSEDLELTISF